MYSRIVVPLDGSKLSESVLPYVRSLAKRLKVPVVLLHAVDPEIVSLLADSSERRYPHVIGADLKQKAIEYLEPVAGSLPEPAQVNCSAEIDEAAEAIIKRAAAEPRTLIAMATHGRSEVQRWFLGSVAHKVLLATQSPLLLVRPAEKLVTEGVASLKRVLVPLDGSNLAEKVLPHVEALSRGFDLEIVLLRTYTLPRPLYYGSDIYIPKWNDVMGLLRENAQQYLDRALERLQAQGLRRVSTRLIQGDAAPNIIEIAKESPDTLIALCSHGRSGIGRLVLGSIADRVVRHSGDPVLVVRAQAERE